MVMALMLATARRVVDVAERVKAGEWTESIGPAWFGVDAPSQNARYRWDGVSGLALAQRAHLWPTHAGSLSRPSAASGGGRPVLTPATAIRDTLLQEADLFMRSCR